MTELHNQRASGDTQVSLILKSKCSVCNEYHVCRDHTFMTVKAAAEFLLSHLAPIDVQHLADMHVARRGGEQ